MFELSNHVEFEATLKHIHNEFFSIINEAPCYKINDIIENNQTEINIILVKLLAQTITIEPNEYHQYINSFACSNTTTTTTKIKTMANNNKHDTKQNRQLQEQEQEGIKNRQFALISLRKISTLGMSNENLFDIYRASDDIKYNILCYLKQNEIHSIMCKVDHEWNKLCKNTFYTNQFKYKFKRYINRLFGIESIGGGGRGGEEELSSLSANSSSIDIQYGSMFELHTNAIGTRIYFQCPWNCLWTYGTIIDIDRDVVSDSLIVEIETDDWNPFAIEIDNENKENKKNEENKGDRRSNNSNNHNSDNYKINDINNINRQKETKTRLVLKSAKRDEYNIVPIGTMDTSPMGLNMNHRKFLISLLTSNNYSCSNDSISVSNCKYKDIFNRQLVDVKIPFSHSKPFSLWKRSNNDNKRTLARQYNKGTWLCGVIDFIALEKRFPKWRDQLRLEQYEMTYVDDISMDMNDDVDCSAGDGGGGESDCEMEQLEMNPRYIENFQIPVLIDITEILDIGGDHLPNDLKYYKQFVNIFSYGKNLYFTRIWYHPHKIMLPQFDKSIGINKHDDDNDDDDERVYPIQVFGSKTHESQQNAILSMPMNLIPTTIGDIDSINNSNVLDFGYVKQIATISIKKLIKDFVIEIKNIGDNEKDCDYNYDYLMQHFMKKMVLFRDYDGELTVVFVIKLKNIDNKAKHTQLRHDHDRINYNKREFKIIAEEWSQFVSFKYIVDRLNMYDFSYFYNVLPLRARPVINFDLNSLIDQNNAQQEQRKNFVQVLVDSNEIEASFKSHTIVVVDIKPEILTLRATEDELWYQDMNNGKQVVGIDCSYNHDDDDDSNVKNLPYENLMIEGCFNIKMTHNDDDGDDNHGNEWRLGAWLCEKDVYQEYDAGFNDYLWDLAGEINILIDITNEFDQFQEFELKPRWIEYQKRKNNDCNSDEDHDDTKRFEKMWNNRKYFVNCYCLVWDKKSNKIFYKYWVHLDDVLHVAPFATFTQTYIESDDVQIN